MTPEQVIALTNQYRKEQGLPELKQSKQLTAAALARATDMAKTGSFSHVVATTSPFNTPWTFVDKAGYDYKYAGENLATLYNDAPSMVQAWKNSPSHNKNLTSSKYSDIGVAIVPATYKGQQTSFVVQFFGSANPPKTLKVPQQSPKIPQAPAAPLKISVPLGNTAETTPQVIPNNPLPKKLSL